MIVAIVLLVNAFHSIRLIHDLATIVKSSLLWERTITLRRVVASISC